jgi:molecular chaperone DnaJ
VKIEEAYAILGITKDTTDEDLKRVHRKLSFEHHPDRNPEDPNKLKTINEAHQTVLDYKANPHKYQQQPHPGFQTVNLGDIFSTFFGGSNRQSSVKQSSPPPTVDISISFRNSVLGCQRTIKYQRNGKCNDCKGQGIEFLGNGCKECDGFGKKTTVSGNMTYQMQCAKCHGTNVKNKKCEVCNARGFIPGEVSTSITVPPGVPNNIVMELPHSGHFLGNNHSLFGSGDSYSSVHIRVNVEQLEGLELVGQDVVSRLTIPLVEALAGAKHNVPTIDGPKEISIEPLTRHQQEIILPSLGVSGKGNQRVIVNVEYPADVSKLIEVLKG